MSTTHSSSPSAGDLIDGLSPYAVGGGILTYALFPLALPGIVLTVVAALILLVPLIPLAVLALPFVLVRRVRRRDRGGANRAEAGEARRRPAHSTTPGLAGR